MKSNFNVTWDEPSQQYFILDISPFILQIFEIDRSAEDTIGCPLSLPLLLKYLNLLRLSPIHYIEFVYPIRDVSYTAKIVEEKNVYTIIFESIFQKPKNVDLSKGTESIDNTFLSDVEDLFTNDKTISEIFAMRNATQENINLEILYVVKKIQEQFEEFKEESKEAKTEINARLKSLEDNYVKTTDFNFYFFLSKIGLKRLVLFIFIFSIIETLIIEPFITPFINQVRDSIVNVVEE